MLPLAKFAVEAHAPGDPEGRDEAPLDLLAGLPGSFCSFDETPARLITLSFEKTSPRLVTGRIRITPEVSNGASYNSCSMRRVLKTANKPLEIKPQEKSVWICVCGLSKNQPYCEGSHKKLPTKILRGIAEK